MASFTFINSGNVTVFPSGFRGQEYNKSKLTTEDNLALISRLSSYSINNEQFFENPYDENTVVIHLSGYFFIIPKASIPNSDSSLYAFIKLREINNIGQVLAPIERTPVLLDENSTFYGLGFAESEADITTAYASIQIRDAKGALLFQKLKLSSDEIRDNISQKGIDQEFTTKKIISETGIIDQITAKTISAPVGLSLTLPSVYNALVGSVGKSIEYKGLGKFTVNNSNDSILALNGNISLPANATAASGKHVWVQTKTSATNLSNTWVPLSNAEGASSSIVMTDSSGFINAKAKKAENADNAKKADTIKQNSDTTSDQFFRVLLSPNPESSTYTTPIISSKILANPHSGEIEAESINGVKLEGSSSLTVGKDGATGLISIASSSSGGNFIGLLPPQSGGEGIVYLPNSNDIPNTTSDYIWAQNFSSENVTNKWIPLTEKLGVANSIVMTDEDGKLPTLTIADAYGNLPAGTTPSLTRYGSSSTEATLTLTPEGTFKVPSLAVDEYGRVIDKYSVDSNITDSSWSTTYTMPDKSAYNAVQTSPTTSTSKLYLTFSNKSDVDTKDTLVKNSYVYLNGSTPTLYAPNFSASSSIKAQGDIKAAAFYATSDARRKENIEAFNYKESILNLPIKRFDLIDGPKNQIGCLAQDLQEFYPELVQEDSDGYLQIQENKLVYLLLEEIKILKKEIEALKN